MHVRRGVRKRLHSIITSSSPISPPPSTQILKAAWVHRTNPSLRPLSQKASLNLTLRLSVSLALSLSLSLSLSVPLSLSLALSRSLSLSPSLPSLSLSLSLCLCVSCRCWKAGGCRNRSLMLRALGSCTYHHEKMTLLTKPPETMM